LRGALAVSANRRAALVTVAVAALVFGSARFPLAPGFEVDLRTEDLGERSAVRLIGFGDASPEGRRPVERVSQRGPEGDRARGPEGSEARGPQLRGRVRFNRPLPTSFTLLLEGSSDAGPAASTIEVGVGGQRFALTFKPTASIKHLQISDSGGVRELVFLAPAVRRLGDTPASPIALRRLILQ
jgi:hypothetical protein